MRTGGKWLSTIPISHNQKTLFTLILTTSFKIAWFFKNCWTTGEKMIINNPNFTWPKNTHLYECLTYLFQTKRFFDVFKIFENSRKMIINNHNITNPKTFIYVNTDHFFQKRVIFQKLWDNLKKNYYQQSQFHMTQNPHLHYY